VDDGAPRTAEVDGLATGPGRGGTLDDGDVDALPGEPERERGTGDAGPGDEDLDRCHAGERTAYSPPMMGLH
jgi:hypothetical protein